MSGWRSPSIAKGTCSRSSRKWAASTTIPDTPFTIYYVIDYDADEVRVFYIEHQRMNPMGRFS